MRLLVVAALALSATSARADSITTIIPRDFSTPTALAQLSIGMPLADARRALPALAGPPGVADPLALEMPVPGVRDTWYRVTFDDEARTLQNISLRTLASPIEQLTEKLGQPSRYAAIYYWYAKDRRIVARTDLVMRDGELASSWFIDIGMYQPLDAQLATTQKLLGATRDKLAAASRTGLREEPRSPTLTLRWIDLPPTDFTWTDSQRWYVVLDKDGRASRLSTTVGVPDATPLEAMMKRLFGRGTASRHLDKQAMRYRRGSVKAMWVPFGKDMTHHDLYLER